MTEPRFVKQADIAALLESGQLTKYEQDDMYYYTTADGGRVIIEDLVPITQPVDEELLKQQLGFE